MAKKKESPGLIAQLQDAIRTSGKSLYQLSKDSGVGSDQLSRFMRNERTLTLPAVEKICRVLRLDLARTGGEEDEPAAGHEEAGEQAPRRKGKPKKGG